MKNSNAVINVTFERPTPADAESLLAAQIRAFESDAGISPGSRPGGPRGYDQIESVLEQIRTDDYHKIVADGRIVGGLIVAEIGQGHFNLDRLYIDPDYHNLGIGALALQWIEQSYPATLWTLNTPTFAVRNQHFYEKYGYVRVGEFAEPDHPSVTLIEYEKHMRGQNP